MEFFFARGGDKRDRSPGMALDFPEIRCIISVESTCTERGAEYETVYTTALF